MALKTILPISTIFAGALLLLALSPAPSGFAAQPAPPLDPAQANRDVRQGAQNLDANIGAAINNLQKLTKDVGKLKNEAKDAKKKADDAAKAAEKARDAAADCKDEKDKKKILDLINQAKKKQKDAQNAKDKMDKTEKDLRQAIQDTVDKVDNHIKDLQGQVEKGMKAAKDAGYADNSVMTGNLRDAGTMLNRAVDKARQEGTWEGGKYNPANEGMRTKLEKAQNEFNPKIREAKEGNDPAESLGNADKFIKAAESYLDNCPPKVGMVSPGGPEPPTEVAIHVGNDQGSNACVEGGDASALGGQVIGDGPGGTIINSPLSPQTIERIAKEKGIKLCWVEVNYCTIYTPLTAYRGHKHVDHVAEDGRYLHDHDAPDPPLDWGVTPPQTVIRLEER